jgi:hypothetical protein
VAVRKKQKEHRTDDRNLCALRLMMCILFVLAETKNSPTLYTHWVLPLVIKKTHVMMLLLCSVWRHDVSFSPLVDML